MTQFKKGDFRFSLSRLLKHKVFDQPSVDNGGLNMGRSVAADFNCCLFAFQQHFNSTLTPLPRHLNCISMTKKGKKKKKKKKGISHFIQNLKPQFQNSFALTFFLVSLKLKNV